MKTTKVEFMNSGCVCGCNIILIAMNWKLDIWRRKQDFKLKTNSQNKRCVNSLISISKFRKKMYSTQNDGNILLMNQSILEIKYSLMLFIEGTNI